MANASQLHLFLAQKGSQGPQLTMAKMEKQITSHAKDGKKTNKLHNRAAAWGSGNEEGLYVDYYPKKFGFSRGFCLLVLATDDNGGCGWNSVTTWRQMGAGIWHSHLSCSTTCCHMRASCQVSNLGLSRAHVCHPASVTACLSVRGCLNLLSQCRGYSGRVRKQRQT